MSENNNNIDINDLLAQIEVLKEKELLYQKTIKELKKSTTYEIQSGYYERKIIRRGDKKKEKTVKYGKNPEKISIGFIGNIEVLAYPYSSFDKAFLRLGKEIQVIDQYDLPKLLVLYNKLKWFFEEGKTSLSDNNNDVMTTNELRDQIRLAYNNGFIKENDKMDKIRMEERKERFIQLDLMKEEIRLKILKEDKQLAKDYYAYSKSKKKNK